MKKIKEAEAKQQDYYTQTAGIYEQMHGGETGEHALALEYFFAFASHFKFNKILDVGCGTGAVLSKMLKMGLDAKGLEPVQALVNIGIQKHSIPDAKIFLGRAERIPFPDASFDAVTEFGILHHVPEPRLAIREMMRVSQNAIFLSDENRFGRGSAAWRLIKYIWWVTGVFPIGYYLMTKGRGYHETVGDGISYSYSVYDSFRDLSKWASRVFFIPLGKSDKIFLGHAFFSTPHVMLCAFRIGPGR